MLANVLIESCVDELNLAIRKGIPKWPSSKPHQHKPLYGNNKNNTLLIGLNLTPLNLRWARIIII
jgi:hypothetical protein